MDLGPGLDGRKALIHVAGLCRQQACHILAQQLHRAIDRRRADRIGLARPLDGRHQSKQRGMLKRKANIGPARRIKAGLAPARCVHRRLLAAAQLVGPVLAQGIKQRLLVGKMAIDGRCADADLTGNFAQRQRIGTAVLQHLKPRRDQRRPQIPMMIAARGRGYVDTVIISRHVIAVNIIRVGVQGSKGEAHGKFC